jgi:hypothetical protein
MPEEQLSADNGPTTAPEVEAQLVEQKMALTEVGE